MQSSEVFKIVLCIGTGYVGSLTMTIFAHYHPHTLFYVYDTYKPLIHKWNKAGQEKSQSLPIVEESLDKYFYEVYNRNLFFITDIPDDILALAEVVFVCVNTPSLTNHKYETDITMEELSLILNKGIELSMENVYKCVKDLTDRIVKLKPSNSNDLKKKIIVQKSTVALHTLTNLYEIIHSVYKDNLRKETIEEIDSMFSLVNIPEFLAEGTAITNLINPDRIVIGHILNNGLSKKASDKMRLFYEKWIEKDKFVQLDSVSSEMTKLVSNAFLAQRISSINTISELCEKTNANINDISLSVGSDRRIGKTYLKASMGFGGSCFKKDILSLIFLLNSLGLPVQANYWAQVLLMNDYQRLRVGKEIEKAAKGKPVSICGLAFKGNVGDVRCSNAIFLLSYLLNHNHVVRLYDPYSTIEDVISELRVYDLTEKDYSSLTIIRDIYECSTGSSVVVFTNDHSVNKILDLNKLTQVMNKDVHCLFDLYNNFTAEQLQKESFSVFKLGQYNNIQP